MKQENKKINGYYIHLIRESKFKDLNITLKLISNNNKKKAALRAMLSYMFITGTTKLDSAQKLSAYLDEQYGMSLSTTAQSIGNGHILTLKFSGINGSFLPTKTYLTKTQIKLLNDVLNHPNMDGRLFDEMMFEIKKNELIENVKLMNDNKISYSASQLLKRMDPDGILGISSTGNLEDIRNLTLKEVSDYYFEMINSDEKHIYVVGDVDENIYDLFAEILEPTTNINLAEIPFIYENNKVDIRVEIEKQQLNQAKLNIGYSLGVNTKSKDNYAMMIANVLLGGNSQSKLFKNVREENSLCYYISSNYHSDSGVLTISSGINESDCKQVLQLISKNINSLQNGEFTDQELEQAKISIIANINKTKDSSASMISLSSSADLYKKEFSYEGLIKSINFVSREEITEVSKKIKLDTIYLLSGGDVNGKDLL